MNKFHNSLQCIIPPYMLRAMLVNGNSAQKQIALAGITGSAQFRGQRQALSESVAYLATIPATGKQRKVFSTDGSTTLPGKLVRGEEQTP